jgi:hypothetical protein
MKIKLTARWPRLPKWSPAIDGWHYRLNWAHSKMNPHPDIFRATAEGQWSNRKAHFLFVYEKGKNPEWEFFVLISDKSENCGLGYGKSLNAAVKNVRMRSAT